MEDGWLLSPALEAQLLQRLQGYLDAPTRKRGPTDTVWYASQLSSWVFVFCFFFGFWGVFCYYCVTTQYIINTLFSLSKRAGNRQPLLLLALEHLKVSMSLIELGTFHSSLSS